jgi:hypothetical protein
VQSTDLRQHPDRSNGEVGITHFAYWDKPINCHLLSHAASALIVCSALFISNHENLALAHMCKCIGIFLTIDRSETQASFLITAEVFERA